jgi:hypothetical protein
MIYRKNVGSVEQVLRIGAGVAMVACGLLGLGYNPVGYAVAGMGAITVLTGIVGYCPACAVAGRRPKETST